MGTTGTLTHAERQFKVTSPLGPDVLLFNRMNATERLSGLYQIELDLWSETAAIDVKKILGTPVGVSIELPRGGERHLHGLVTDFGYEGNFGDIHAYRATLRPWLWLLTRTADCRIFQNLSTPEIIMQVFRDFGFTDFRNALGRSYEKWIYCVQYRETAFNFVSRLMEHEGIYYYFEHKESKHTLVLADATNAHGKIENYEKIPFYPPQRGSRRVRDHITDWSVTWEVQSGKYTQTDFDFEKPSLDLKTEITDAQKHAQAEHEVYDYPGLYVSPGVGGGLVRTRMDEIRTRFEVIEGQADARGIAVGALFDLTDYPRMDMDREYLVTSTTIHAASNEYASTGNGSEPDFGLSFTAMPSNQQFRPPRLTPKPVVTGPQTATVVGTGGDEIYVDKYGRVKVQFHWDRLGKKDENSSCWVRVAQLWAGKTWGAMFIPRIGQEVIVDFLEGDPDQPIITGRVYNGEQTVPYPLPGEKTKSTIKSDSSKGHGGSNEIRFEDLKGSEEIYVHAQKDRNLVIEHDETKTVHHDRVKTIDNDETTHVKHDRTETVDNNETITIHGARTETVDKDETITIHQNRTETVDKNETITINGGRTETVAKDETIAVNGGRTETVAKDETITINGGRTETVAKDESITINGGRTENVSKDESVSIGGGRTVSVTKDDGLSVGKNLSISAGDSITITCGSASITMKKNGDITIDGKAITIKGSGDVIIKGQKILQN